MIPGAVNRTATHRLDASGKGINVTRVLTQLGKKAMHLTQLGGETMPLFLSLCEQDGLSVEWVESKCLTSGQASQIRFCYTVLTENDGYTTELVEESRPVAAGTEQRLLEKFDVLLNLEKPHPIPHSLIISGTKAAGFSDNVIPIMVRKAKEKGLRIILDIKGKDLLECLKYEPDIIKPNLDEFTETFKTSPNKEMLIDLARKHKCRIVLTDGSRKILAACGAASGAASGVSVHPANADSENYFEVTVNPVKAVNTTGCGDAFTAGLAAALQDGSSFHEAINEGIRCGTLNAGLVKPGVIC
ncbi:MAG: PfkB family carbohydrate kinase [Treponema sp.]|nr:PfkB family carbohydrate kinase [Treponema sp.]